MTATLQPAPSLAPFRRPTWQEAVAGYLPDRFQTRGERWANHLPVVAFALLGALLAMRLGRTAFIDEALYINAGQDYLISWRLGTPAPDHARDFSGAPVFYPVIAATLEVLGGLRLVRLFSTLLVVFTTFAIAGTARALFGYRAGVFAAGMFAVTGPVIFVGALGTFDALCIGLLAAALWVGTARHGWTSGLVCGLLLAAAPVAKYTTAVFLPAVWWVVASSPAPTGRRPRARALARGFIAAISSAGLLVVAYVVSADEQVRQGIAFTTAARQAMSPTGTEVLTRLLVADIGLVAAVAVAGALLLWRSPRLLSVGIGLLGAAALLPAAQLRLGEAVSFDKHTAYSALFLAPLAGVALQHLSRRTYRFGPPMLVVLLVLGVGGVRAGMLHREWPDVTPIVARLEAAPAGIYLSSSADVLKYYTRRAEPQIVWETTFELYAHGHTGIRQAIEDVRYAAVVVRASSTSNPQQDAGQATLLEALADSPHYRRLAPIAVGEWGSDRWLIFQRRADAPAAPAAPPPKPPAAAPHRPGQSIAPPVGALERPQQTAPLAEAPADAVSSGAGEAELLLDGLRRGSRGELVRRWQSHLQMWDDRALPRFGVDGIFGAETEEWTERYLAR